MAFRITKQPTTEPVTLQQLKNHLRIYHSEEDTLLENYLKAARTYAETTLCWRAFIRQEIEFTKDRFPWELKLPRPPLQSVTSITYTDKDGTEHTIDPADYIVDTKSEPGRVVPAYGKSWPTETLYPVNAVKVSYTAGYPTYEGTVDTAETGKAVTWVSGDKFNPDWPPGQHIVIAGTLYQVESVTDDENLVVTEDPGDQTGVAYSANEVPVEIKQAILILAAHFYEQREPVVVGSIVTSVPWTVEALAMPCRAWGGES